VVDLCTIGLKSFFEGFCVSEFALAVDLFPPLIERLPDRAQIESNRRQFHSEGLARYPQTLGWAAADTRRFGTPQEINRQFHSLLGFLAIDETQATDLDAFRRDRNMLVHFGGMQQQRYRRSRSEQVDLSEIDLDDTICITRTTYLLWSDLIQGIARRIADESRQQLIQVVESAGIALNEDQQAAVDSLGWCEWDDAG
jgi:hypothetical protein